MIVVKRDKVAPGRYRIMTPTSSHTTQQLRGIASFLLAASPLWVAVLVAPAMTGTFRYESAAFRLALVAGMAFVLVAPRQRRTLLAAGGVLAGAVPFGLWTIVAHEIGQGRMTPDPVSIVGGVLGNPTGLGNVLVWYGALTGVPFLVSAALVGGGLAFATRALHALARGRRAHLGSPGGEGS
jgi:hypothetical protein